MKTHAHFKGAILCGQANAKNIPLEQWIALPEKDRCRKCRRIHLDRFGQKLEAGKMMLTKDQHREALRIFDEYFAKNYPGNTIIGDPHWHAPKILRAAEHAIESALLNVPASKLEAK